MAGVIRREQFTAGRRLCFADLEQQGRRILEQAQQQASKLVAEAEARSRRTQEERRQAGYRDGHQTGLAEGRAEGLKQIRAEAQESVRRETREHAERLIQALGAAVTNLDREKRGLIALAETGLIELALAIARRVCKLEAGTSTAAATANAKALLEMVQHAGDAELHFHPGEHEQLRELAPEFLAQVEQLHHVRVIADEQVTRGGCILQTADGAIDTTIETQLERIAAALRPAQAVAAGAPPPVELPAPATAAACASSAAAPAGPADEP